MMAVGSRQGKSGWKPALAAPTAPVCSPLSDSGSSPSWGFPGRAGAPAPCTPLCEGSAAPGCGCTFLHALSPWIKLLRALPSHNSSREPDAAPACGRRSASLRSQRPHSCSQARGTNSLGVDGDDNKNTRGENSKALLRLCTAINLLSCITRGAVWQKPTC